jgi:hypothetical protein
MNNFEKNITFVIVSFKSGHVIENVLKVLTLILRLLLLKIQTIFTLKII